MLPAGWHHCRPRDVRRARFVGSELRRTGAVGRSGVTEPFVDVVIACHDQTRPLDRAVRSVLQDETTRHLVRVTVVAHGLPADALRDRVAGIDGAVRIVEYADGIRSAAGPFNHGLSLVTADYCAVLGSDDFLEPGALAAWIRAARERTPDMAIACIRIDGEAKDRLFYRTAPLGLIRTATMRQLGLGMTEGVRVGEDFVFSIRLFTQAARVDFLADAPCYVIGLDARERTTLATMDAEEDLEAVVRLLDEGVPTGLNARHRRALAVKLTRVSIIGKVRARPSAAQWRDDTEVMFVATLLRRLLALHPGAIAPFNRQDRAVLDALLTEPTIKRVTAEVARAARAGRLRRWFTPNILRSFDRESTLRRYVLYVLRRERTSA
nr:glycosyltransferase [Microbacterium aquimaris]